LEMSHTFRAITTAMLHTLTTALLAAATVPESLEHLDFDGYIAHHNKVYAVEECASRRTIFEASKAEVVAHNVEYRAGRETYWLALNQFADATPAEFAKLRATKYAPLAANIQAPPKVAGTPNPDAMDWRDKGAVTDVKNQGGCGSCWAFSATETLESHNFITNGQLLELAPQTFVDCVQNPHSCGGTGGCEGATMELAFNLTKATGIALEAGMPYKGRDESCPSSYKAAVKVGGYVKNPVNDASALETALASIGPMSVTVAAASWQLYGGGVFNKCSKKSIFGHGDNTLDHGVQAVGYTADAWLVRNSWGAMWGEKGYIRLARTADNATFVDKRPADGTACKPLPTQQIVGCECGVCFDTSYPTGVTQL